MSESIYSTMFSRLLLGTLVVFAVGSPGHATTSTITTPCADAVPLEPNTTWRDPGRLDGIACFTLDLHTHDLDLANVLVIDLLQPAVAPRAHVDLIQAPSPAHVVMQTATTLVLTATPGPLQLRVATDDPKESLAPFRLDVVLAYVVTRDEDDTELELEPDPLVAQGPQTKDEDDTELELEPDPLMAVVDTSPSDVSFLTHRLWFVDRDSADHGDTLLQATPLALGHIITGDLTNDWGDDVDVFRFDVTQVGPIAIQIKSNTALDVELFDRHELRIAVVGDMGVGARVTRTLVAGTYFLRIGSAHRAVSHYSLIIDTSTTVRHVPRQGPSV